MHGHGGSLYGFPTCIGSYALLQRRNERVNGRFDDRKVCRWWDFQATLGKTILLSDIAGTALSTTRLVDWLLLMLLNPLVGFHRGRTMCFRASDQKNQASGLPLGSGRQKKNRIAVQSTRLKILQRFYRGTLSIEILTCVIPPVRTFRRRYRFRMQLKNLDLFESPVSRDNRHCSWIVILQFWKVLNSGNSKSF